MLKKPLSILIIITIFCTFLTSCSLKSSNVNQDTENSSIDSLDNQNISNSAQLKDYCGLAYYPNENINPVLSTSKINNSLCSLLYEGLFVIDNEFEAQKVLCESYSIQESVITLKIKPNITFWSGKKLTAEDVVYTYITAKNSENSIYKSRFEQVSEIKQADETTITITLSTPNTDFIKLLDIPIFRKQTENNRFSDGTGAYYPVSENGKAYLLPSDNYRLGKVTVFNKIDLVTATRADTVFSSFETGSVSIASAERIGVSKGSVTGSVETYKIKTTDIHYLGVNHNLSPYNISAVRCALSAMLARSDIARAQLQDYSTPAILPTNTKIAGYELNYNFNREAALNLLGSIGISDVNGDSYLDYADKNGMRVQFSPTVTVNEDNEFKIAVLKRYKEDLATIGITLQIRSLPFEQFQKALSTGDFELYYGETLLTSDFNISPLVSKGGTLNFGQATGLEEAISKYQTSQGNEKKLSEKALYEAFLNNMPIIPIAFEYTQVFVKSGLVQNISPTPFNTFYSIKNWSR